MCISPMLARSGSKTDLDRDGYIFEPKIDGIRATCEKNRGLRFYNRSCRDISSRYPELDFGDALNATSCVLDGEIVLYDRAGNPDFTALMQRHLGTRPIRVHDRSIRFAVFDILSREEEDLTDLPLVERKKILRDVVGEHAHLEFVVFTREGHRLWDFIQKRSLEGVIAKDPSSDYRPGRRTGRWLKIKAFETMDAVIIGFTQERRAVSALAVAVNVDDEVRFVGKVGIGLSDQDVRMLKKLLTPIGIDDPPCDVPASYRDIQWVEPRYVCEVRYLEFGKQGMLRNPIFVRLRPDKEPEECQLEM